MIFNPIKGFLLIVGITFIVCGILLLQDSTKDFEINEEFGLFPMETILPAICLLITMGCSLMYISKYF